MLAIQFVISIIYIGSWFTFLLVRIPRVIWGLLTSKFQRKIYMSMRGAGIMKADWIFRIITLVIHFLLSLSFSVWLPEQFCDLIGVEERDETKWSNCKWQVFGFRFVFILLYFPLEILALAVVYRNATDIIFKIQLRKMTGISEVEMEGK